MKLFFVVFLASLVGVANADAGRILYVSGSVTVERAGQLYRAVERAKLLAGDTIETRAGSRVHVRMSDRSLLSLKPDTRFVIEEFRFTPAPSAAAAPDAAPASASDSRSDISIFRLARGGFRAVTGLIGQRNKEAFRVGTGVATIGIRGTSFVADLEVLDSGIATQQPVLLAAALPELPTLSDAPIGFMLAQGGSSASGSNDTKLRLTVGVGDGSVILTTRAGSLILENGEFGVVDGADDVPRLLLGQRADSEAPDDEAEQDAGSESELAGNLSQREQPAQGSGGTGEVPNGQSDELVTPPTELLRQRNLAISTQTLGPENGGRNDVLTLAEGSFLSDDDGQITAFRGAVAQGGQTVAAVYELSGGAIVNAGQDPSLGLRWGRWSGESGILRFADGREQSFSLNSAQLHFIQSAIRDGAVALPTSGTRDFALVGNTDPTDQNGVVGFLGRATLSANFSTNAVQSDLALTLGGNVWSATGSGQLGSALGVGTPGNVFTGDYTVSVDGSAGTGVFGGFITDLATGAGLTYRLDSGGNSIGGVAAFGAVTSATGEQQ